MRDVIQKVIAAEAEAKRILGAGRAEGDRILSEARQQAQELAARSRQEARAEAGRILESAVQEAEGEKQKRLSRSIAEIEAQIHLDEATRQHAVDAVVRFVCGASLHATDGK